MTQAGPGTAIKQEQEEISPKHLQAFSGASLPPRLRQGVPETRPDLTGAHGDTQNGLQSGQESAHYSNMFRDQKALPSHCILCSLPCT